MSVPQPPPAATVPQPPPAATVPQPPPAATVPQPPPAATVPQPPPAATVPQPQPAATVPQPQPAATVPQPPPPATVPQPPPAATVPQPPPAATVPQPPPAATVPQPPPAATVPQPPPAAESIIEKQVNSLLSTTFRVPSQLCVSEGVQRQLEEATLKQFSSAGGDHYLDLDTVVRDHVCKLFFLSNYDVGVMMANVVKSLHCLGRYDVGLLRNDDSTAFTVVQSTPFNETVPTEESQLLNKRRCLIGEAKERIERVDNRSKARLFGVAEDEKGMKKRATCSSQPAPRKKTAVTTPSFPKSSYEQIQELLQACQKNKTGVRRSSSTAPGSHRHSSPGSGGYHLWRYGGQYPKENYYEHYRLHGLKR